MREPRHVVVRAGAPRFAAALGALVAALALNSACGTTSGSDADAGTDAGLDSAPPKTDGALPVDGASPSDAGAPDGSTPDSSPPPEGGTPDATADAADAADAADPVDAADAADAAVAPMVLTSPTITDGGRFPAAHTCTGVNRSPSLTWTAGPPGTGSYAIVMKDLTVPNIHWTLYDIPVGTLTVGAGVPNGYLPGAPAPAGAKHAGVTFSPSTLGYLGPCPPSGDHDYVFTVHAVTGATLAGAAMSDAPEVIEAKILAQRVAGGSATLSSKYMKP